MRRRTWIGLLVVGGVAVSVPGACDVQRPQSSGNAVAPAAQSQDAPVQGQDAPSPDRSDPEALRSEPLPAAGRRDAEKVAESYALAASNWSYKTFENGYRNMVGLAAGKLLRELQDTPPDVDTLRTLREQRQTNTADVIAATTTASERRTATIVVVLRELAGSRGLTDEAPAHNVYRATTVRTTAGWRVAEWEALP